jgi:ElaB/YqjD/DUF883 family membrane-anchored ribosome-binding protein
MADDVTAIGQKTEGNRTDWSSKPGNGGLSQSGKNTGASGVDVSGTAEGLTAAAHKYTDKISEAATQAKDFVSDKASIVNEKIKEFANNDLGALAEKAKDFARANPGQAILVSAAAGLLLGLFVRGRR